MAKRTLKAKIERDPVRNAPSRVHAIKGAPTGGTPKQIAVKTLKKLAPTLKIDPDLKQLRFDKVKKTVLGDHVLFQQCLKGTPISGAWVRVDIDRQGKVYNVLNDLVPQPKIEKAKRSEKAAIAKAAVPSEPIKAESARKRAVEEAGGKKAGAEVLKEELVYYPIDAVPVQSWKVIVQTTKPRHAWKMYLDAFTGKLLYKANLLRTATGQGRVFNPNPVVSLNDTSLSSKSKLPPAAYVDVVLRDLKPGGRLDGKFVSTKRTPNRVKRSDRKFTFFRTDRAFKEVMVYFHIDAAQRYIQELGFDNILNRPVEVHIDGRNDDNSDYNSATKALTFGIGGVDDAEDAEIILHEYGHAIQDDQVPGWGETPEAEAMGEGFGDYFAGSFFADAKPQNLRPAIGSWDAIDSKGNPPCLRRLDSKKTYPKDIEDEEHLDGEIWSACLWELRRKLGRHTNDRIVLAHHFLLKKDATFEDGAKAMLLADEKLNKGKNKSDIRDVFVQRGILPKSKKKKPQK
jgi:Zn-dependent metalloprotease